MTGHQAPDPIDPALRRCLAEAISRLPESDGAIIGTETVDGGSIAASFRLRTRRAAYFLKLARVNDGAMFSAEADGLAALAKCPKLRVPQVIAHGVCGERAYLLMEHIELQTLRSPRAPATTRRRVCCMAISGTATRRSTPAESWCCSIRRCTSAIAKPTSR